MKLLITGITGFSGRNLLDFLRTIPDSGLEIIGFSRSNNDQKPAKNLKICQVELMDYGQVLSVVNEFKPDIVFHLAGKNKGDFFSLLEANVICTKNLLDAIIEAKINPFIIITGSSSQYGFPGFSPISEETPFAPLADYGVTKCCQEIVAQNYIDKYRLNIVITRTFNLIGEFQPQDMFIGSILNQLIEIKKGLKNEITVFHLNSSRDYIDVRDAVRAYWMLVTSKKYLRDIKGEKFNIGSGHSSSLHEVLSTMLQITGMDPVIQITDPNFKDAIPTQIASIDKISDAINWSPEYSLRSSIMNIIQKSGLIHD